jgi:hypothetical protein
LRGSRTKTIISRPIEAQVARAPQRWRRAGVEMRVATTSCPGTSKLGPQSVRPYPVARFDKPVAAGYNVVTCVPMEAHPFIYRVVLGSQWRLELGGQGTACGLGDW